MIDVTPARGTAPVGPPVVQSVNDDTGRAPMSITVLRDKLSQNHRLIKQQRDLARALAAAPTPSSRHELLGLTAYNNS